MAADPVKVDPKHYKVEFENDQVRVLRVSYGPGEKSVMHGHPNTVLVCLADAKAKFTYPDGKMEDIELKAGQATWSPAGEHLPENGQDKPISVMLVELK
jgi:quercetin dioxygenase-like cupin family protein